MLQHILHHHSCTSCSNCGTVFLYVGVTTVVCHAQLQPILCLDGCSCCMQGLTLTHSQQPMCYCAQALNRCQPELPGQQVTGETLCCSLFCITTPMPAATAYHAAWAWTLQCRGSAKSQYACGGACYPPAKFGLISWGTLARYCDLTDH